MLLSRFWYVVLSALAGISIAAMLVVRNTYERDRGRDSETLLRGDRRQIDEFLRVEARARLDNLVAVASDPDLTRAMEQARTRANDGAALNEIALRVAARLRTLNSGLGAQAAGQLLMAVDHRGFAVARTGLNETAAPGEYVGGIPVIARALDGFVRDDMWELQGHVYRVAARPIISGGRYVGAIVHAREIDNDFVRRISEALGGASIAFFTGAGTYASQAGEPDRGRPAPTPTVLVEHLGALHRSRDWTTRGYTEVMQVQRGQGAVVYGTIAGTVGVNGGGFVVGRPRPVMPADYLLHAPSEEVKRVPWPVLIGLMLGASILGLLFVYLERDRGENQLLSMLQKLAERKLERLDPLALRGSARKTALAINDAFERAMKEELARAGAKPRRSVDDLETLLGPENAIPASASMPDIPPPPPPPPSAGGGLGLPLAPPPQRPMAGPPMPPGPPPAPAPMARPMPPGTPALGSPLPSPHAMSAPVVPASRPIDDDQVATTVAPRVSMTGPEVIQGAGDFDERSHWREVFDQFVAAKKQCGEATDALTFDKFGATLQRHKEQLVQRTQCKSVRFTVTIKENKATLKASPVK